MLWHRRENEEGSSKRGSGCGGAQQWHAPAVKWHLRVGSGVLRQGELEICLVRMRVLCTFAMSSVEHAHDMRHLSARRCCSRQRTSKQASCLGLRSLVHGCHDLTGVGPAADAHNCLQGHAQPAARRQSRFGRWGSNRACASWRAAVWRDVRATSATLCAEAHGQQPSIMQCRS
jgi:hypothetical protein